MERTKGAKEDSDKEWINKSPRVSKMEQTPNKDSDGDGFSDDDEL